VGLSILVTNDDGVAAPGISALARALLAGGHRLVVAAPLEDRSGSGAGVGPVHLGGGTAYERFELPGLEQVPVYGIDGPPALAVMLGCLGGFGLEGPPDLVVSGINCGYNTGRAVLHSGTVGAALTAANLGVSALAVSVQATEPLLFDAAGALAGAAVGPLSRAAPRTVINLNVPGLPLEELRGLRRARLHAAGSVTAHVVETPDTRLEIKFGAPAPPDPDSDVGLTAAGYATLTPLAGVGEDAGPGAAEGTAAVIEASAGLLSPPALDEAAS
jgi:5'-nucleotidase